MREARAHRLGDEQEPYRRQDHDRKSDGTELEGAPAAGFTDLRGTESTVVTVRVYKTIGPQLRLPTTHQIDPKIKVNSFVEHKTALCKTRSR